MMLSGSGGIGRSRSHLAKKQALKLQSGGAHENLEDDEDESFEDIDLDKLSQ